MSEMFKNAPTFPISIKEDETYSLIEKRDGKNRKYGTSSIDASELSLSDKGSTESLNGSYPIAVIFVLLSKTFEAFAANGVRSILALYLRDSLRFNEDFSTTVLHTFNFFSQFLPIVGAILADSYLGNAKTVFIFCIPYALGYLGSFLGTLPYEFATHFLIYASLLLIAVGNGCLRACITALGGYQFKLPQQRQMLDRYFALYYFFYYSGILLGKIVPAYVRTELPMKPFCHENEDCYPTVFGFISIVFLISWIIFLCGMPLYRKEHATGNNTMLKVCGCICYAAYRKAIGKSKGINWLRGSTVKYSEEFVNDVIIFIKVITLFIPIPIYYALLVQQDSTWTFQATQTDTEIFGVKIAADQFKAIGPVLLLIQIPVWQRIILPMLERHNIHIGALHSVSIGGLCAAFAYVCSGFLQHRIAIDPTDPPSILWQFPQFFLVMLGEVLISVPGLKFCYTHAPSSMKSVLTAVWFINNAMGNLIVVTITELNLFDNRSLEQFFYAFLMFAATIVFTLLAENFNKNNSECDRISEDQGVEGYIHADAVQAANLEENFYDGANETEHRKTTKRIFSFIEDFERNVDRLKNL